MRWFLGSLLAAFVGLLLHAPVVFVLALASACVALVVALVRLAWALLQRLGLPGVGVRRPGARVSGGVSGAPA